MKKLLFILFILNCFCAFGNSGDSAEEIDYLLFLPDNSSRFVNEEQAQIQLDKLAQYLLGKQLLPGVISVYGYAAQAANNVEPMGLSRDRAVFVINELQKRGVAKELFNEPVGCGSVDTWGSNSSENNRSPNRRVRVMLDGNILPAVIIAAEPVKDIPVAVETIEKTVKDTAVKKELKFNWAFLIPLLLIPLLVLLLLLNRKKRTVVKPPLPEKPLYAAKSSHEPTIVNHVAETPVVPVPPVLSASTVVVDLEEEIRFCAYYLYQGRVGQNGSADSDWHEAVSIIRTKYEADGYTACLADGRWQACKTVFI